MPKTTQNKHLQNFAITMTALTLLRNEYKPVQGELARSIADADLYIPKDDPANDGQEFAVHAFWLDSREDIAAVRKIMQKDLVAPQMPHYLAFVIGQGSTLVVSEELEKKMIYSEDGLTVETLEEMSA